MTSYLLLVLVIFIGATGQIMMKIGANQISSGLGKIDSPSALSKAALLCLTNPYTVSVLILYGLGFFIWILTLTRFDLSFAFPVVAVIYILVIAASWLILKEQITFLRLIGSLIIAFGIILVFWTQK